MTTTLDVDDLLARLLGSPATDITTNVTGSELMLLAQRATGVFRSQPVCLELQPPVVVCGDFHAQFEDLLRTFNRIGFPPVVNYLFLGDYVDRGPLNLETISLLFCLKILHPANIFLLRGNHETYSTNAVYGFRAEVARRYRSNSIWQAYNDAFAWMPLTALIGSRILCMHGGLSPLLRNREQLRRIGRPFLDPPIGSLEMDLLWSDPDPHVQGWKPNPRGCSFVFGHDEIRAAAIQLDVDIFARAHQMVQDGYELNCNRQMITVFSAPNYCGEFNNSGAAMIVDRQLTCSFMVFAPQPSNNANN